MCKQTTCIYKINSIASYNYLRNMHDNTVIKICFYLRLTLTAMQRFVTNSMFNVDVVFLTFI